MTEIYITCLLQILTFSSRFKECEMKNFLRRPTMVADNISLLVASKNFLHFYGPVLRSVPMSFFRSSFPFFFGNISFSLVAVYYRLNHLICLRSSLESNSL